MDAVEFVKNRQRMCSYYGDGCIGCPMEGDGCWGLDAECLVGAVEAWSAEHPRKTRQSEFLKMYPNAFMDRGVLSICPMSVDNSFGNTSNFCKHDVLACPTCRREFWLKEIE